MCKCLEWNAKLTENAKKRTHPRQGIALKRGSHTEPNRAVPEMAPRVIISF